MTSSTPTKARLPVNTHTIGGTAAYAHASHAIRAYTAAKPQNI